MRDNLRQRIVQDIIAIVTRSDTDNDDSIDRSEAKTLALRIQLSLQEYGVVFDTQKFMKAIGDKPTVQKVIGMVQKLFPAIKQKKDDDDDSDFDSDEESDDDLDDEVYDMFYMAEEGEGAGGVSLLSDKKSNSQSKRSETIRRSVAGSAAGSKSKSGKGSPMSMEMVEEGSDSEASDSESSDSEGSDADSDY
mmetsp:Transcript_25490/g.55062  ORF Transcript_25490/g.55062 Transcript_25490/m.55062 type:complete len:192 (-) Transcript_25490:75-650(-)